MGSFVVAPNGSASGAGTEAQPLSLAKALSTTSPAQPGDTILLRGGTYAPATCSVSGAPGAPIVITNYSGEQAMIDGSIPAFRAAGNTAWEVVDAVRHIYRSTATHPKPSSFGELSAFVDIGGDPFSLIPYKNTSGGAKLAYLSSDNHNYDMNAPRYMGPGVLWNDADLRYYIRLVPSTRESVLDRDLPAVADLDPRQNKISLCNPGAVCLRITGHDLVVDGLRLLGYQGIELHGAASATFRNLLVDFGMFVARCGISHHLTFDNLQASGHMPPSLAYLDVKGAEEPAATIRKCAFDLGSTAYFELCNSHIASCFDGMLANAAHDLGIHYNTFADIWDDLFQIPVQTYNLDIGYNRIRGAGPSHDKGSGTAINPGTKWIHDNVIDTSTKIMWTRNDPLNKRIPTEQGMRNPIAISSHGVPITDDPWKFYNNTVIAGAGGVAYPQLGVSRWYHSAMLTGAVHEVYNNIFILLAPQVIGQYLKANNGKEIYDGNLYWSLAGGVVWNRTQTSTGEIGTLSGLAALKASQAVTDSKLYYPPGWESHGIEADPRLDADYQLAPGSPALYGGVDLSDKGWPGTGPRRGAVIES